MLEASLLQLVITVLLRLAFPFPIGVATLRFSCNEFALDRGVDVANGLLCGGECETLLLVQLGGVASIFNGVLLIPLELSIGSSLQIFETDV